MNQRTCTIDGCERPHLARGYCRPHYRKHANPDKPRDRRVTITCADCGETAQKLMSANTDRTRCVPCAYANRGKTIGAKLKTNWPGCPLHTGECVQCGTVWAGPMPRKYCGDACLREASTERHARTGTCRDCGVTAPKGKYYCERCKRVRLTANRRRARKRNRANRGENHRKRARRFGVPYEPVSPAKVYERDGWTCQLCGHQIDPDIRWPHPRSRSLDHVVPMSMGGPHAYDNLQLACLECNTLKGARLAPHHGYQGA